MNFAEVTLNFRRRKGYRDWVFIWVFIWGDGFLQTVAVAEE